MAPVLRCHRRWDFPPRHFFFAAVTATTVAFLLLTLLPSTRAAHGDNMSCIGCAVTMEHAFARVAEHATTLGNRLSLTEQETHTLDLGDVLKDLRHRVPAYRQYSPRVATTATEMTTRWLAQVASAFAGDEPTEGDMYARTHKVCVKTLDYCDDAPTPGRKLLKSPCSMCKAVVADIVMVVQRKEKGYDLFRTKPHVYDVLDSACSSSVLRIPPAIHTKFSSACEEVVEEHEHALAQAIIDNPATAAEKICGPEGSGVCPKGHDGYRDAWTSIFHQVPVEDKIFTNSFIDAGGEL